MGWFAFYVGKNITIRRGNKELFYEVGDVGVGRCDLNPGIIDNVNGTTYVVSDYYMDHYYKTRILKKQKKVVQPDDIKKAIELFYKPNTN